MTWFHWQVPPFVTGVFFILGVVTLYWATVNTLKIWIHEWHLPWSDDQFEAWYGLGYMIVFVFGLQALVVGANYSWQFMNFQLMAVIFCGYFVNLRVPYYTLAPLLIMFMWFNHSWGSWESWAHGFAMLAFFGVLNYIQRRHQTVRQPIIGYLLVTIPFGGVFWVLMQIKFNFTWRIFWEEWLYLVIFEILIYLYVSMLSHNSELRQQLEWSAEHDELTHAENFAAYTEALNGWFKRHHQHQQPLTMMMFDIDHFKHINDTYGHLAGDQVLKQVVVVAQTVIEANHAQMRLYRTGGEEFNVLMPVEPEVAKKTIQQIFLAINHTQVVTGDGIIELSISVGSAALAADVSPTVFYDRVDKNLYHSKQNGRMQITSD
ncbi:GGDEF domain-containing protein [Lactiplantibacillus mudanjiangensis]|uniref:GGDEF domain-containing protein [Lactobacillus sp.] n=1 Tax=Lactiplantibacillus mudanjiangensis TaxID=1296538 RepID=A0A660E0V5_9LACO|nr:GGDEF domain-containing protein [Lactiplantibacillus mudanjiangensis]VDG21045.1 GGDEF domain-containing protein [Lactobacillus sp.] [Lactiplantibacillus mudanjiangensis]VDG26041.1 GGDEF domain-containing protein [Lactobacillus sp.] [Lactiplantibacillus mudanjiangensis]VDG29121.1 GGDEF domain-containing protein [Lactobacillus sp.] [Lactiplantibacillus mudanjiangensis]VDG31640.1 GGDEF domain-containing protein [Lactobacillus sp.] [Lactiplantibacillus mudanjiangensis]